MITKGIQTVKNAITEQGLIVDTTYYKTTSTSKYTLYDNYVDLTNTPYISVSAEIGTTANNVLLDIYMFNGTTNELIVSTSTGSASEFIDFFAIVGTTRRIYGRLKVTAYLDVGGGTGFVKNLKIFKAVYDTSIVT